MTKTRDLADLANGITSANIVDGAVTNADINSSAAVVSSKLAFTQSGTGAVQRTVESKLQDVVSVKDFGAVGDGVADDTAAIQAAIDATAGKAILTFPPLTYKVTSSLLVPENSILQGEKQFFSGQFFTDTSKSTFILFEPTSSQDLFTFNGTSYYYAHRNISGFYLKGNANARYAINATKLLGCVFDNIEIEGFDTSIYLDATLGNTFSRCCLLKARTQCIKYGSGASTTDVWTLCYFSQSPKIAEVENVVQIRFISCIFESSGIGFNIHTESTRVEFTSCYCEDMPASAYSASGQMFRVGYDGTVTPTATALIINGGRWGGRNASPAGTFLDVDRARGLLLSNLEVSRFSSVFNTTASSTAGCINVANFQGNSNTTLETGQTNRVMGLYAVSNISGVAPNPLAKVGSVQAIGGSTFNRLTLDALGFTPGDGEGTIFYENSTKTFKGNSNGAWGTLALQTTGSFNLTNDGDATGTITDNANTYVKTGKSITYALQFTTGAAFTSSTIAGLPFNSGNYGLSSDLGVVTFVENGTTTKIYAKIKAGQKLQFDTPLLGSKTYIATFTVVEA